MKAYARVTFNENLSKERLACAQQHLNTVGATFDFGRADDLIVDTDSRRYAGIY